MECHPCELVGGSQGDHCCIRKLLKRKLANRGSGPVKKKSCHTKDGVVIMYQFGYCWDLDVVAFEIKIPPFQFVWQWRACQGLPPAIGANYVRSRTKRISWSNDIVRDSFFSVAAALAILCRCNLLQLTKGGQRWRQQEQRQEQRNDIQKIRRMWKPKQHSTKYDCFSSISISIPNQGQHSQIRIWKI